MTKDNKLGRFDLYLDKFRLGVSGSQLHSDKDSDVGVSAQTHRGNRQVWYKDTAHGDNGANIEKRHNAGSRCADGRIGTDNKQKPTGGTHSGHGRYGPTHRAAAEEHMHRIKNGNRRDHAQRSQRRLQKRSLLDMCGEKPTQ
eukprot:15544334-Heterocapsa_arctica.AAC.1